MGMPHFNTLAGGDPLRLSGQTLLLQKLEESSWKPHNRIFIYMDKTLECDG